LISQLIFLSKVVGIVFFLAFGDTTDILSALIESKTAVNLNLVIELMLKISSIMILLFLVARSLLFQGVVSKHEKLPSLKGIDSL
jgi:hypothetical protein